jgi:hypothetical protein
VFEGYVVYQNVPLSWLCSLPEKTVQSMIKRQQNERSANRAR